MNKLDIHRLLKEEIEFCERMELTITRIKIGVFILRELTLWNPPPLTEGQMRLFGIPLDVVPHGNPWAVNFEREPISKN